MWSAKSYVIRPHRCRILLYNKQIKPHFHCKLTPCSAKLWRFVRLNKFYQHILQALEFPKEFHYYNSKQKMSGRCKPRNDLFGVQPTFNERSDIQKKL